MPGFCSLVEQPTGLSGKEEDGWQMVIINKEITKINSSSMIVLMGALCNCGAYHLASEKSPRSKLMVRTRENMLALIFC